MNWTRGANSLVLLIAAHCGGPASTLHAQAPGWTGGWVTVQDPIEHAFTLETPRGWTGVGGAYRFGYGDVRAMVDIWSPDGKTNLRFGDVWFTEQYALPTRYHREGEAQDLGALGQGIYAAYRTGQEFADLYARKSFSGVCRTLTPQRTDPPSIRDTSVHREGNSQFSEGEVTFRCETAQGLRIAYAAAKTTMTTSQPFADLPPTTGWAPQLVSFLAPPDQVSIALSIARHFWASFKVNPQWSQYQNEMDRQGTAYAVARARRTITQQQQQFASFTQRMNDQMNRFQQGQARQQGMVDNFLLVLNGEVKTNDPTHPTVPQGTHQGKWNCGGKVYDSDLPPGLPGCRRID